MVAKKKVAKKKATRKKAIGKSLARNTKRPASLDDYLDPNTGELMNAKHEMFVQTWVQTFDNEKSCLAAGLRVDDRNAYHNARYMLRREEIQLRVRSILRERITDMQLSEDWVVLKLLDTFDLCMREVPVMSKDGEIVGYGIADARTGLRALELIGMNMGMFKKVDNESPQKVILNLNFGGDQQQIPAKKPAIEGASKRLQ